MASLSQAKRNRLKVFIANHGGGGDLARAVLPDGHGQVSSLTAHFSSIQTRGLLRESAYQLILARFPEAAAELDGIKRLDDQSNDPYDAPTGLPNGQLTITGNGIEVSIDVTDDGNGGYIGNDGEPVNVTINGQTLLTLAAAQARVANAFR